MSSVKQRDPDAAPKNSAPSKPDEVQFADAVARTLKLQEHLKNLLPRSRVAPLPDVKDITREQWQAFNDLVLVGVTPHVAAQQTFFCSAQAFAKWMRDGAQAPDGTLLGEFYRAVTAVKASARAIAEVKVYFTNPLVYLTQGPGGRPDADEPGWREDKSAVNVNLGVLTAESVLKEIAERRRLAAMSVEQVPDDDEEMTQ